jgi:hypothetical protein
MDLASPLVALSLPFSPSLGNKPHVCPLQVTCLSLYKVPPVGVPGAGTDIHLEFYPNHNLEDILYLVV